MIPYKTSPLDGTVHENGTVRTADDLFAKDIGAVEILNAHSKTADMKIFTSYSVARIVRPDANFVATKLFYREHRKSVSETFPGLADEVQVQAAIQIHRRPRQFGSTPFGLRIYWSTRKLPAWRTQVINAGKGVGL